MKRVFSTLALLYSLFIFSCKKDGAKNSGTIPTGGDTIGNLLYRVVTLIGQDSTVAVYNYDLGNNLVSELVFGKISGSDMSSDLRIVRDGYGRISKVTEESATLKQNGIDSMVTRYYFDNVESNYGYLIRSWKQSNKVSRDSIILLYNGNGDVYQQDIYHLDIAGVSSYELWRKIEYVYNGSGAITEMRLYQKEETDSNPILSLTYFYGYDEYFNPYRLNNNEAILLGRPELKASRNLSSFELKDLITVAKSYKFNTTYTYNTMQWPVSGVTVQDPGGNTKELHFYYR